MYSIYKNNKHDLEVDELKRMCTLLTEVEESKNYDEQWVYKSHS